MAWNNASIRPPGTSAAPPVAGTSTAPPAQENVNTVAAIFDPNDTASPYFLHPNENPPLILVSNVLSGRNYHPWARAMEMALLSKNKLGFVDGTIPIPNIGEVKYPYWRRCNNMVATWIMRAISPEIASTLLWVGSAERIWSTLRARFNEADIFRISNLLAEIHQIRHGDLTVSGYFAKLENLWDELQVIRPLPTCKCDRMCDCGLLETLQQHLENDNLSVFLRGLNETYASVQSQIMMTKPLPTVDEAFMIVQQQERRFNNGVTGMQTQEAGRVLHTQGNGAGFKKFHSNSNKKPVCTYCGFTGHIGEKCYKKNGYPPGWKPRQKVVGSVNQVATNTNEQVLSEDTGSNNTGSVTLSLDDYRLIKQLLHRNSIIHQSPLSVTEGIPQANLIAANFAPNSQLEGIHSDLSSENQAAWILDSGATHHVVCHHSMLTNAKEIQGMFFELPNGGKADITHIGSICADGLVLQNVLCVPAFHYNLISDSELIKTSKCKVLLYSDWCIIQDQECGEVIRLANLQRGLYYLVKPTLPVSNKVVQARVNFCNSANAWHARLGHCSYEKLKQIPSLLNVNLKVNKDDV
ncbi:PREDICTED: uncharacterized protein LOC109147058 [Ipomoea nil]|uniref:uncharacterized protein LOC109147058 n=1 Tax=Ipomoea nil TaxID=35883 RepID=UPI000901BECA|nr:PREDICTED: uncharacterized protein LOC109147058 [Ipomoea nil]